jgi:hypothetical protein
MADADSSAALDAQVRVLRLIHFALCVGPAFLAVVLVVVRAQQEAPPPPAPILVYVGVALTAVTILAALLVPARAAANTRTQLRQGSVASELQAARSPYADAPFWGIYLVGMILRLALLVAPTVFWLIIYFLTGASAWLAVPAGLWLLMLAQAPSRSRVEAFAEAQRERMEQEKQDLVG